MMQILRRLNIFKRFDPDIIRLRKLYNSIRDRVESTTQVGSTLPAFDVYDLAGNETRLDTLWRDKPAAIICASLSCGQMRRWIDDFKALKSRYGDMFNFSILYTIEAHPHDSPSPYSGRTQHTRKNKKMGIECSQPTTMQERQELARLFIERYDINMPVLIDNMENTTWETLGMSPNLGLLVDRDGVVREVEGWFDPLRMDKAIRNMSVIN